MESVSSFLGLAFLVGLVMLFIRQWRRIGFYITGGCVALIVTVGIIEDRAAVEAGFQDAPDQRAAAEAGFTDPDEWAPVRARLEAEEEERERQEAAAAAERERQEAAAAAERERQEAAAAAERERQERQAELEDRRKGFHCLSAWDGSHPDFKRAVKEMMRNPSSFEHIETRIAPVDDEGNHSLMMTYRAENGFGGMNTGQAFATIRQSDCSYSIVSVE